MQLEHKTFPVIGVKAIDTDAGVVEAIVSVFNNVDSVQERVLPGFFADSLQSRKPKGVWMHDWAQPVAKTLEAVELAPGDQRLPSKLLSLGGLYIKGQFNLDTQRGREAFSDIKFGIVDEFSIGYVVTKDAFDQESGIRDLVKGELFEWSPVLVGANPATALLSAKSLPARLKLVEHSDAVLAAVKEFTDRLERLQTVRAKEGRVLSSANRQKLDSLKTSLADVLAIIEDLLSSAEPQKSLVDGSHLVAFYLAHIASDHGVNLDGPTSGA